MIATLCRFFSRVPDNVTRPERQTATLLFGLFLGACQVSSPQAPPQSQAVQPGSEARKITVSIPPEPEPATEVARTPPKPSRIYPKPASLRGADVSELIEIIGEPQFIRRDGPAEIWQYRGVGCTLDIFLYQAATGTPHTVNYIETRAKADGPSSNSDCLVSILKEKEAPNS